MNDREWLEGWNELDRLISKAEKENEKFVNHDEWMKIMDDPEDFQLVGETWRDREKRERREAIEEERAREKAKADAWEASPALFDEIEN